MKTIKIQLNVVKYTSPMDSISMGKTNNKICSENRPNIGPKMKGWYFSPAFFKDDLSGFRECVMIFLNDTAPANNCSYQERWWLYMDMFEGRTGYGLTNN